MKTSVRIAAVMVAVCGLCASARAMQPGSRATAGAAAGTRSAVKLPRETVPGTSATADSYSAQLLREQAERKALREQFDFATMPRELQADLWDELVGPDQINDGRGVAMQRPDTSGEWSPRDDGGFGGRDLLVDLSWIYTPVVANAGSVVRAMSLTYDGDVTLVGTNTPSSGINEMKAIEVSGTRDSTQNWATNWITRFTAGSDGLDGFACASDLLGNTYAAGSRSDGRYYVRQINGADGTNLRNKSYYPDGTGSSLTAAAAYSIAVDPEGIVFASGSYIGSDGSARSFVSRLDPNNALNQDWIVTNGRLASATETWLTVDRRGGVYVAGVSAAGNAQVTKYDGVDGFVLWTWTGPATVLQPQVFELDFDGNPHVVFRPSTGGSVLTKLDRDSGSVAWAAVEASTYLVDIKIDASRNVFAVGTPVAANAASVIKYTPAGVRDTGFAVQTYGTTMEFTKVLALDFLGNPYVFGSYGDQNTMHIIDLRKFNPATGALVWSRTSDMVLPSSGSSEVNRLLRPTAMVIDAGGSVYLSGYRTLVNTSDREYYCAKYEQPFVSIPQIAASNVDVRLENHSVWKPEVEDPGSSSSFLNSSFNVFNIDVDNLIGQNPSLDELVTDTMTAELDYVFGTVKGQVGLNLSNNVNLGVNFETAATGGTYDATVKGELRVVVPGEGELFAGQDVPIVLDFKPDSRGMEMIANATPEFSAQFVSNATGTVDVDVTAWNKNGTPDYGAPFLDLDVFPTGSSPFNLNVFDDRTLLNVFGASPPAPGTWVEYEYGPVSGQVTMPDLRSKAVYSTTTVSGSNQNNTNDDDTMTLTSNVSEEFFNAGISVTDILSESAVGVPLSFGWSMPAGDEDNNIGLDVGLVQVTLNGNLKFEQDLAMNMKPYVRLEFPGTGYPSIERELVKKVNNSDGTVSFVPENPIDGGEVLLPSNGEMEIVPYFGVRGKMRNQSGFRFGAWAGFDPLSLSANFTALGVNIFSLDRCFYCQRLDIASGRFNVWDYTPQDWFKFTGSGNTEQQLASIFVKGDSNLKPQLIGLSRASARMIIYNQRDTTPTATELAAVAGGTEPMIVYGRKFLSNTTNRAFISHHGQTKEMTTVRLNDQALLVQVPRRFYLLPGVARVWVSNGNGKTASLSLPIEYPMPNFVGIQGLDSATDPTVWAGDPRWRTAAVVAIDGGTPAGNDSFIARRDYYSRLASMWSSSLFETGEAGRNQAAAVYFPAFPGWSQSVPPGFPTLAIDGVALARQRPVTNDGYFRSVMQTSLIAVPKPGVELVLSNPGPGGGESRTRTIDIPAPPPVVSTLTPSTFTPGSLTHGTTLRVVVRGPESVPSFGGYEKKKAGNFTPESVVRVNGVNVATTFSNSGLLTADVPASMLDTAGVRYFTVYTPSDGTSYYEVKRNGLDGSIASSGNVASGGLSVPVTFEVRWPQPEITALSVANLRVGHLPETPSTYNGQASDGHNFAVTGKNFAPGSVIVWNGMALDSTRVDAGSIRATLTAEQVAEAGTARVWVNNPAPNFRSSRPQSLSIVP